MLQNDIVVKKNLFQQRQQVTCGDFATEIEACAYFDNKLEGGKYFNIEKEVIGRRLIDFLPCSVGHQGQSVRIDRILYPTEKAIEAGWIWGPIGVEIKKSNMAIGPILAQVMEQRQSLFRSVILGYARISLTLHAVFPVKKVSQDLHSLCETQSILNCYYDSYTDSMKFSMPTRHILKVSKESIEVKADWQPITKKGHRGREK